MASTTVRADGTYALRYAPSTRSRRYRLEVGAADGQVRPVSVRERDVVLDAVGDINMGDGVADVMAARGRYPWRDVAPILRSADIAFGNLECSVSTRGTKVPKTFNFRGSPAALREVVRFAGARRAEPGEQPRRRLRDDRAAGHRARGAVVGRGARRRRARRSMPRGARRS